MSRNFALLHRAGKEALVSVRSTIESPPQDSGFDGAQQAPPDGALSNPEEPSEEPFENSVVVPLVVPFGEQERKLGTN